MAPATAAPEAPVASSALPPSFATHEARQALYAPAVEQVEEVEARVVGRIPSWLNGSLIVNGGGDYTNMLHMFDGFALLTKVRLQNGSAWGSQRYLQSDAYTSFKRTGRRHYREFATPLPADSLIEKARNVLAQVLGLLTGNQLFTDNASVNLVPAGPPGSQRLLAMSETPSASYLVDAHDLSTLEQVHYTDGVKGDLTTAHPSILSDGRLLNFTRSLPYGGFHLYTQDPVTLRRSEVAFVADRHPLSPAWLHDFAATDDYAVLVEHPLYMNLSSLLSGAPTEHIFMDWKPEDGTRVHVVRLDGSEPTRTFNAPPFFCFHYGNVFEEASEGGGRVLQLDMAAYDDPTILNDLLLQPLLNVDPTGQKQVARSYYKRLTIPLAKGAEQQPLPAPRTIVRGDPSSSGQDFAEFSAHHPDVAAKPYHYAYCLSAARPTNMGNALSKIDVQTGESKQWHMPGGVPGEAHFVPRPGGTDEDDGVVLSVCMGPSGKSFLVVLDGKSFEELGRAEMPFAMPNRFHGLWMQQQAS